MKTLTGNAIILGALVLAAGAQAQTILSSGHVDIGIAYEDGAWDLHAHDHASDAEFEPGAVTLTLNEASARPVPSNASFSFLGSPGSTVYVLPQVEEDGLLFLGLAAEEIAAGAFTGDLIRMSLRSVSGPGNFSVYSVNGFGTAIPHMTSGNGIGADDFYNVSSASHSDLNWAFSAPGLYTIGFEASGTHAIDGPTASGVVNYTFEVIPEPTAGALLLAGGALLLRSRKARR